MPADIYLLVRGQPNQGTGKEVFGCWSSGLIRQITAGEYKRWGFPPIQYTIPTGPDGDAEFAQYVAYDRALRG
ncbi:hypothetical protein [Streptomyces antarcticus]|uniref:hypothetical protein n=1 Tax=Streptomyces antarcticus TaxID=2996458 RepID=UPI00226ECA40|nr:MULTISPECIES: hypothetical protein [unclassified Streptomyces]MCY0944276.1 hypothetical protein [Streptomyces sp. H34-AA3]MCY0954720.1 hypothetical protein [Streptomyces sp. H27-S2]MCZ4087146.1 hypothetical protein [Streptomyces sp. H34-S5]